MKVKRLPSSYNLDVCWSGCKNPSDKFYLVSKNNGYWANKNEPIEKYSIGLCNSCSINFQNSRKLNPAVDLSNTKYEEVSKKEAIIYDVMDS